MSTLIEQLKDALDADERIATNAMIWRKAYLESGKAETWETVRHVNNETPPFYDYVAIEARLGAWGPQELARFDRMLPGVADLLAQHMVRFDPKRMLDEVAAKRELLAIHYAHWLIAGSDRTLFCYHCEVPYPCREVAIMAKPYGITAKPYGIADKLYGIGTNA